MTTPGGDLSGGLDPGLDYFLPGPPEHPGFRDSASLWIMNDDGEIAFPRITIDAVGEDWEHPRIQINAALADGRALRVWSGEAAHAPFDERGLAAIRGAGPLRFQCLEPLRRWRVSFAGQALQTTSAAQLGDLRDGETVDMAFDVEARMAAPPWLMGGMTAEAARKMKSADAGALMGGLRYEQLCRLQGRASIAGREYPIAGTGMRVRRQGVRNMGAATGHCQHSALFPSGRAFGAIAFAPGADGSQSFNEGFVYGGEGALSPARVLSAPWMTQLGLAGEDASLVLHTPLGEIAIAGETMLSTFDHHLFEMAGNSVLHQGVARYTWDGEETIGLIERCTLRERLRTA
ncbi:hypothetical protein [Haliea sp. E17]|uniref:hypothetical protein n=1 Tax=Haliea sp. E17 TaxID=3401576 RepID=UPI003AAC39DC